MDNGSRVSFKASHDLGEGLSALAYTELRFSKNVTKQKRPKQEKTRIMLLKDLVTMST